MAGDLYYSFVLKLRSLYPEQPLPGREVYRECLRSLAPISFASPAVEFCRYVYVRRMSWFECSWERDILPLEEDTTIFPNYVLSVPFLRYYFPMCLHVAIKYFQGEYAHKDVGNVKFFVERTLCMMAVLEMLPRDEERQFMAAVDALFADNEFYKDSRKVADACCAWRGEG